MESLGFDGELRVLPIYSVQSSKNFLWLLRQLFNNNFRSEFESHNNFGSAKDLQQENSNNNTTENYNTGTNNLNLSTFDYKQNNNNNKCACPATNTKTYTTHSNSSSHGVSISCSKCFPPLSTKVSGSTNKTPRRRSTENGGSDLVKNYTHNVIWNKIIYLPPSIIKEFLDDGNGNLTNNDIDCRIKIIDFSNDPSPPLSTFYLDLREKVLKFYISNSQFISNKSSAIYKLLYHSVTEIEKKQSDHNHEHNHGELSAVPNNNLDKKENHNPHHIYPQPKTNQYNSENEYNKPSSMTNASLPVQRQVELPPRLRQKREVGRAKNYSSHPPLQNYSVTPNIRPDTTIEEKIDQFVTAFEAKCRALESQKDSHEMQKASQIIKPKKITANEEDIIYPNENEEFYNLDEEMSREQNLNNDTTPAQKTSVNESWKKTIEEKLLNSSAKHSRKKNCVYVEDLEESLSRNTDLSKTDQPLLKKGCEIINPENVEKTSRNTTPPSLKKKDLDNQSQKKDDKETFHFNSSAPNFVPSPQVFEMIKDDTKSHDSGPEKTEPDFIPFKKKGQGKSSNTKKSNIRYDDDVPVYSSSNPYVGSEYTNSTTTYNYEKTGKHGIGMMSHESEEETELYHHQGLEDASGYYPYNYSYSNPYPYDPCYDNDLCSGDKAQHQQNIYDYSSSENVNSLDGSSNNSEIPGLNPFPECEDYSLQNPYEFHNEYHPIHNPAHVHHQHEQRQHPPGFEYYGPYSEMEEDLYYPHKAVYPNLRTAITSNYVCSSPPPPFTKDLCTCRNCNSIPFVHPVPKAIPHHHHHYPVQCGQPKYSPKEFYPSPTPHTPVSAPHVLHPVPKSYNHYNDNNCCTKSTVTQHGHRWPCHENNNSHNIPSNYDMSQPEMMIPYNPSCQCCHKKSPIRNSNNYYTTMTNPQQSCSNFRTNVQHQYPNETSCQVNNKPYDCRHHHHVSSTIIPGEQFKNEIQEHASKNKDGKRTNDKKEDNTVGVYTGPHNELQRGIIIPKDEETTEDEMENVGSREIIQRATSIAKLPKASTASIKAKASPAFGEDPHVLFSLVRKNREDYLVVHMNQLKEDRQVGPTITNRSIMNGPSSSNFRSSDRLSKYDFREVEKSCYEEFLRRTRLEDEENKAGQDRAVESLAMNILVIPPGQTKPKMNTDYEFSEQWQK